MSIEQRIINVAEKQNYYDSRELRAIALEVRKREDRIKQLEDRVKRLKEAGDAMHKYIGVTHDSDRWNEAKEETKQ